MRWLILLCAAAVGASSLWLVAACTTPAAELRFTGSEYPVVAVAADIEVIEGDKPPVGHRVIGVATASCATLNGTTGLLADGPCSRDAMLELLREKAAAVGGQAIVDPQCGDNEVEREVESRDGGYTTTTTRELTVCQATVTRQRRPGALAARAPTAAPSGETVMIGETPVSVRLERAATAPSRPARDEADVGELEAFPAGYPRLGSASAECASACSRSTARRALKRRAAQAGALAIARIRCELLGQRWRCQADLVAERDGPAPPTIAERDAGTVQAPDGQPPVTEAPDTDAPDADAPDAAPDAGTSIGP